MADYFSVLQGAVGELDINTAAARRDIYDRARNALLGRLRSTEPKLPEPVIEAELESLNQAIERVENEHLASRGRFSRERYAGLDTGLGVGLGAAPGAVPPPIPAPPPEPTVGPPPETRSERRRDSLAAPKERPRRRILAPLLAAAVGLVLAIVVTLGTLIYWPRQNREVRASAQASQAGSASYVYMRQPVYYRTTHPPGTILVDKAQRFAYVVLPNVVALRYGIGVGPECAAAQGLHTITRKEEWPGRAADSGFGKIRNLFAGPREDNPLGARALYLQEYRLHGTNAPSGIGSTLLIGCVALINESIIEFYDKAPLETRVVFLE
ncbi:MAG: L,D-transpeptidase [Xanthobacteraceae bacterium]|nr:L,D-transpeptidase [Xanthobacteraceae bacterium]